MKVLSTFAGNIKCKIWDNEKKLCMLSGFNHFQCVDWHFT